MPVASLESGSESDGRESGRDAPYSRRVVLAAIGLATGLAGATWYVGDREEFGSIGTGGTNAKLLPTVGEPAPNLLALRSPDEGVFLSEFLGQPVWLNFWGSWCQPCRVEMPGMQAAWERLAPRGLVLLAVALDESFNQHHSDESFAQTNAVAKKRAAILTGDFHQGFIAVLLIKI